MNVHKNAPFRRRTFVDVPERPVPEVRGEEVRRAARRVTEPPAAIGKLAQLAAQFGVRRPARPVADHLAASADDAAGPTLRQTHDGL
jgi:hypothetical protein